ncbi:hypothetical protein ACHAWF_011046 [Thalassiosira exigua]
MRLLPRQPRPAQPHTSTTQSALQPTCSPVASLSRRALSSAKRSQTLHNTIRLSLACECSSLRYALLLSGEGEDALLRGWDDGIAVEDEDGT